jgi:hypothetical protein
MASFCYVNFACAREALQAESIGHSAMKVEQFLTVYQILNSQQNSE